MVFSRSSRLLICCAALGLASACEHKLATGKHTRGKKAKPKAELPAAHSPEVAVRTYLKIGASGDLSSLQSVVDGACYRTPIGEVDATRLLGTRIRVKAVSVNLKRQKGKRAEVDYRVEGAVTANARAKEIDIFGKPVRVRQPKFENNKVERSGTLSLIRRGSRWRITCP